MFLVEGDKNVSEVLHSNYEVMHLFATPVFLAQAKAGVRSAKTVTETSKAEIEKCSLLKNPQNSLAICKIPKKSTPAIVFKNNFIVYLDDIQDPGNLGTIVRMCDWFGIGQVFCSPKSADLYNPKVIQSTMGSFCRVEIVVTPFEPVAGEAKNSAFTIFGASMEGGSIYAKPLPKKALIVFGNEGKGIGNENRKLIDQTISIPSFSQHRSGAESLNVSIAAAIICAEFQRQNLNG